MIRFIAEADPAPVLVLGFSYASLELLARDHPLLFQVDASLGGGSFAIVYVDSALGSELVVRLAADHVLPISDKTLVTLGEGGVMLFDAATLGVHACSEIMCFAGPDDATIVDAMRASGMLVPDDAATGPDAVAEHEATGCPWCAARRAYSGVIPRKSRGADGERPKPHRASQAAAPRPRARGWRDVRRWALFIGVIVAAGLVGLLAERALGTDHAPGRGLRPYAPSVATQTIIESDQVRRAALSVALTTPFELSDARCTGPLPAVSRPASAPAADNATLDAFERFERSWQLHANFMEGFDVMPSRTLGVGPVRARLHRDDAIDHQTAEFAHDLHITFIVEGWVDPVLADPVQTERVVDSGAPAKPVAEPGVIAGRIVVWSYRERAFVCASETVVVKSDGADADIDALATNDRLTGARLELLLEGIEETTAKVHAIAR